MIMNIVIAFFVIQAILFVFEIVCARLRNDPEAIAKHREFLSDNNLPHILRENKEIADFHARFEKKLDA